MVPTQNAFQQALKSLANMTPRQRAALASACLDFGDNTTPLLPQVIGTAGDFTFYADGSVAPTLFESYINSQVASGRKFPSLIQHNAFFQDNKELAEANGITFTKAALDNIAYNLSVDTTPMFTGAAFSAVLVGGRFDPKSVRALPYAYALRNKSNEVQAILASWQAKSPSYVPLQQYSDWAVI